MRDDFPDINGYQPAVPPKLVSRVEVREKMWCEVCGIEADKRRWPTGWSGCGESNWIFNRDYLKAKTMAHWCPDHPFTHDHRWLTNNEAEKVRHWLRRVEREIDVDLDAAPARYSARREGLIPMKDK